MLGAQGTSFFSGANVLHHYHGMQITVSILLEHDVTLPLSSLYHRRYNGSAYRCIEGTTQADRRDHTKLRALELADEVALLAYRVTARFPREELMV